MKKVIVTGATGAIGIALVEALMQRNIEVTVICHRNSKRINRIPKHHNVSIIECNLDEMEMLSSLLEKDYDVFYHLAWECTVGDSRNNIDAQIKNIQYIIKAVELAQILGCKRFVGAGSQAEYGRYEGCLNDGIPTFPENGYGMAKLCAGQMSRLRCEQLGLEHIWTRILSIYGPGDGENTLVMSVITKLLKNERPQLTKAEQKWDYLYSKDAAKALILLGEKGLNGKVYCIGSGEAGPLRQYVEVIRHAVNPNAEIGYGDVAYAPKQVMHLCADITDLKRDTGFEADYSFEKGIRETVKWCKENICI